MTQENSPTDEQVHRSSQFHRGFDQLVYSLEGLCHYQKTQSLVNIQINIIKNHELQ